jgi:hypothetical protein
MRDGYRDRPLLIIRPAIVPPAALVTATKVVRVSNIDQNLANPKRIMVE